MRRTIIIQNETHWSTRDLRRFVIRAAHQVLEKEEKPFLFVRFVYARGDHRTCSGCAHLNSQRLRVRIPRQNPDRVDLAHTLAHEIAHTKGITHAQMRGSPTYRRFGNWREHFSWAESLPLCLTTEEA